MRCSIISESLRVSGDCQEPGFWWRAAKKKRGAREELLIRIARVSRAEITLFKRDTNCSVVHTDSCPGTEHKPQHSRMFSFDRSDRSRGDSI